MKLDLNQILTIVKQIESPLITENKGSSVKKSPESKSIQIPKIQISEDWGKDGKPDREVLMTIVNRATRGSPGKDPLTKLAGLNSYLDYLISGVDKDFSVSKVLSAIIVIETMMKMFNSFSYQSVGFINEAFMSVFYGRDAVQIPVEQSSGVEDIMIKKSNQYISLKTLNQNSMNVGR